MTYASLFEFPLTVAEARRTLVRCPMTEAELIRMYQRSSFLNARVTFRHGLFFPVACDAWIRERADRETESRAIIDGHRVVLSLLCALPFVRMLAVSGSLAHLNATRGADLDLFIVTRGRRVWLVTTAIVVLSKLLGVRRTVCANFVVADSRMTIAEHDEFTANQMIHLRPLVGQECLREFLSVNSFAGEIYPNFTPVEGRAPLFEAPAWSGRVKRAIEMSFGWAATAADLACRVVYGTYLRRKAARWASPEQVRIEADYLKLHGNSHRRAIADRYDAALADALAQPVWASSRRAAR